jgi:hypothetical protein
MTFTIGARPVMAPQRGLQVPAPNASKAAFFSFAQSVAKLSSPERSLVFDDAVSNGHFDSIENIFNDHGWLWAEQKFSVMASLVKYYVPGNPGHHRTFRDLFAHIANERRMARLLLSQAEFGDYETQVSKVLTSVRKKDPELANWCEGQWRMA